MTPVPENPDRKLLNPSLRSASMWGKGFLSGGVLLLAMHALPSNKAASVSRINWLNK
jgi:hypothetical protein